MDHSRLKIMAILNFTTILEITFPNLFVYDITFKVNTASAFLELLQFEFWRERDNYSFLLYY